MTAIFQRISHFTQSWMPTANSAKTIALHTVNQFCVTTISILAAKRLALPPANQIFPDTLFRWIKMGTDRTVDLRKFLTQFLPTIEITFNQKIPQMKPPVNFSEVFTGSLSEEAFYACIQSGILRKLPALVLRKFSAQNERLIDHKVAKLARMVLTSAIFALGHHNVLNHDDSMLPHFSVGMLSAILRENQTPLFDLVMSHFAINTLIFSL